MAFDYPEIYETALIEQQISTALEAETAGQGYAVVKRGEERICLGAERYLFEELDKDVLVLYRQDNDFWRAQNRKEPTVALAHKVYDGGWDTVERPIIEIEYVQRTARVARNHFSQVKQALGCHPHEFLIAQFLARIAPILDEHPHAEVQLNPDFCAEQSTYKGLRDRFFNREGWLNPRKKRVEEIVGRENGWLNTRR